MNRTYVTALSHHVTTFAHAPEYENGDFSLENRHFDKNLQTQHAEASLFVVKTEQVFDRGIKRFCKIHGKA